MKIKRLIGVLSCMLLCVGMLPAMAFAANETDTWDGTADTSWYDADSTEFHITTAEQLAGMAELINNDTTNFKEATVYLENDLDLSGHEWISIGDGANTAAGSFQGIFDGQNHVVYNLYSHEGTKSGNADNNLYRNGLFGSIYNATVKNLGIENAEIIIPADDSSTYGKGILADWVTNSNIQNCYTTGSITGGSYIEKYIGGIAGFLGGNNNISQCYSTATITGNYDGSGYEESTGLGPMDFWDSLGGIIGASYTGSVTISDCWFGGAIVVNSIQAPVGGIIGYGEGVSINNCLVATNEIGNDGLENTCWIGYVTDTDAKNCFWPNDDKYATTVSNADNNTSAGTAVDDFMDESLLAALNANAAEGVEWVHGINGPTLSWDSHNIPADYGKVDEALKKAETLNREQYKDFSGVETAIAAVARDKNITEQAEVDAMAKAIEDAVAALEYKDADYTKVDEAIAKAEALSPDNYTNFSIVETAISAVVRGKDITEQDEVDDMALAIENAIANLEKKPAAETPSDADTPAGGEQTGNTTSPETGDDSNIALWIVIILAAGTALAGTVFYNCKKKYSR